MTTEAYEQCSIDLHYGSNVSVAASNWTHMWMEIAYIYLSYTNLEPNMRLANPMSEPYLEGYRKENTESSQVT